MAIIEFANSSFSHYNDNKTGVFLFVQNLYLTELIIWKVVYKKF